MNPSKSILNLSCFSIIVYILTISTLCPAQNIKLLNPVNSGDTVRFELVKQNSKIVGSDKIEYKQTGITGDNTLSEGPVDVYESNGIIHGKFKSQSQSDLIIVTVKGDKQANKILNTEHLIIYPRKNGLIQPKSYVSHAAVLESLGSMLGIALNKTEALKLYQKAIQSDPFLAESYTPSYYRLMYAMDKISGRRVIEKKINDIKIDQGKSEKDYILQKQLYNLLKDSVEANLTEKIILEKYPAGKLVYRKYMENLARQTDANKREELTIEFREKFKNQKDIDMVPALDYQYGNLALAFYQNNDSLKFIFYVNKINNLYYKSFIANSLVSHMNTDDTYPHLAADLAKEAILSLERYKKETRPTADQKTWDNAINNLISVYKKEEAWALFRNKRFSDALKLQEESMRLSSASEQMSNETRNRYIMMMAADGQYEKALQNAEPLIKKGKLTIALRDTLRSIYGKAGRGDDFNDYLSNLEKDINSEVKAHIAQSKQNILAPNFEVLNLKGESVRLSDLKGKIVVLDFWAMWCGPCKASFPAMQELVKKYSGRPDVVFLFVNTMETGDDRIQRISTFLKANNYSFNVILDTEDKARNLKNTISSAYDVKAIPTKFIIDKTGQIRYRSTGGGGGEQSKMVKEVSAMIESIEGL